MRTYRTKAWWQAQLADFATSGMTQRQFASQRQLSLSSLRHRLYVERKAIRPAEAPELVELQWQPAADLVAVCGGLELRIAPGTDPAWLAELLRRLAAGAASC